MRVWSAVFVVLFFLPEAAPAVVIDRCGTPILFRGQVGDLAVDLDCPGYPGTCESDSSIACTSEADCPAEPRGTSCNTHGPILQGGRLRLNGHTLSNSNPTAGNQAAVLVGGSGSIEGPGTITAPDGPAVTLMGERLVVSDVELRDSKAGINSQFGGKIIVHDVDVHDMGGVGIAGAESLSGKNVSITRTGLAPAGFEDPVSEALSRVALHGDRIKIRGLTATDNGGPGVVARVARIVDGTLSNNAAGIGGWDFLTGTRPRLKNTTCSSSAELVTSPPSIGGSWLVCSGD
jgi:hypothetical protein